MSDRSLHLEASLDKEVSSILDIDHMDMLNASLVVYILIVEYSLHTVVLPWGTNQCERPCDQ